jgi:hypothetical protein
MPAVFRIAFLLSIDHLNFQCFRQQRKRRPLLLCQRFVSDLSAGLTIGKQRNHEPLPVTPVL